MRNIGTLVLAGAISVASLPVWQQYELGCTPKAPVITLTIASFGSVKPSKPTEAPRMTSEIDFLNYIQKKEDARKQDYKTSIKQ